MDTIDRLRNNTLLPQKSEDECRNILFDTPTVSLNSPQINTLHFDYPIVSQRVSLAKRLIDNSIYSDYNQTVSHLESFEIGNRALYQFKQLKQAILPLINELQQVIEQNKYDLSRLGSKNANYKTDLPYFENTYIYYYAQQMLIWYLLEFQAHFITLIPENKQIQLEDIYIQYLKIAIPDTIHISTIPHIQTIKENNAQEINLETVVEQIPSTAQIFLEEVKKYSFFSLAKVTILNDNQKKLLITKMTAQCLPYIVAMLDYLEYPKYLKEKYSLNKTQIYSHISKALNGAKVRQIKGNFHVLNPNSKEDTTRYTAYQYSDTVKDDYEQIASITL